MKAETLAWRLTKTNGETYDVTHEECQCWDWLSRKDGTGEDCKHIAALRAVGLLRSKG